MIKWDVEIGSFSLNLLRERLLNEVKWASNQSATLWFFDKNVQEDVRLDSEIQMIDLFDMYKSEMCCHVLVGVFDTAVCDAREYDLLDPLFVIPPIDGAVNPTDFNPDCCIAANPNANATTTANPNESLSTATSPNANANAATTANPNADSSTTKSPNTNASTDAKASTTANPCTADEADLEPDREPDIFDNEEEYVGVDDEHLYIPIPPAQPITTVNAQPSVDNADPVVADGGVPLEAEIDDADPEEITVLHDPENPKIIKGELFPDIVTFRKAIRHYAVKKGFEFANLKTDKTRFIAKCAAAGCPWRIHASRLYDRKTIQVGVHPRLLFLQFVT